VGLGLGQGATFTVRLPVLLAHDADDTESARGAAGAAGRIRLDGIRVLLVEDEADGREVLRALRTSARACPFRPLR
jgi:hypothetical protein